MFWGVNNIISESSCSPGFPPESKYARMRTILMLGPLPPTIGGITAFIKGILNSNLNKKYNLITFGTERPTVGIVRNSSDYTLLFRIGLVFQIRSVITTMSHLLTFPFSLILNWPDIVHIHTASYWSFWENAAYVLMSKMLSRKTVIHIHGGSFDEFYKNGNWLAKFLIRAILVSSDRVIVLSMGWRKPLQTLSLTTRLWC